MNPNYAFNFELFDKLANLELAILMLTGLLEAMLTPLAGPWSLAPTLLASLYILFVIAVISRYPPVNAPFYYRLLYILLETSLVFSAGMLGVFRLFPLLFIVVVAKGALMLPLRGLLIVSIYTAVIHAIGQQLQPFLTHEQLVVAPKSLSLPYLLFVMKIEETFLWLSRSY